MVDKKIKQQQQKHTKTHTQKNKTKKSITFFSFSKDNIGRVLFVS